MGTTPIFLGVKLGSCPRFDVVTKFLIGQKFFEVDEKLYSTKILSKKACIFKLFYWTKVTKIVKVNENFSDE